MQIATARMPRGEERIIFPLDGFVAAALIRGTRARKRVESHAQEREYEKAKKSEKGATRLGRF